MTAARELEAGAPEGTRPKYLPRPSSPASAFRKWSATDRCARDGCGSPDAACFHWPNVAVDRSPDAATNARFALGGGPQAKPAAASAPVERPRLRGPAELTLAVQEAPAKKKGGRRGR